jgi:hypothetical protein
MSNSFHADLDGGAVIPPENIKAICSELKYNPKTHLLRYCAPKTKLEHKANRKKFPDYTPYETAKVEELAESAEYEFKTDEPYSSEYQTSASSEESYATSGGTAEEASDWEENASTGKSAESDDGDDDEPPRGGRSVRFSERRYEDEKRPIRAGTPTPERKNAEKDDSPDRVRMAKSSSGRNRKSEKSAHTANKPEKRNKRARNVAKSDDDRQPSAAADDDDDDDAAIDDDAPEEKAEKAFSGSVDRRAVSRVCRAKSGGRSRTKRSNNSSAGADKREKRTKVCNPFTGRAKSKRVDVERTFGRRVTFKAAAAAPRYVDKGDDIDREYSEPARKRRTGRIIEGGIVPPDTNNGGRKRAKRGAAAAKRKSEPGDDDADDAWAPGKAIPLDAVYW